MINEKPSRFLAARYSNWDIYSFPQIYLFLSFSFFLQGNILIYLFTSEFVMFIITNTKLGDNVDEYE
jgi:hypothetical protein